MFEEEYDNRIYNLIISNGIDENNEYKQFIEKIYSKPEFLWKESISPSYSTVDDTFLEKIDAIIILSGLYNKNKEKIDELAEVSQKYCIPLILVRPYGLEEVPENLEEIAASLVGWNSNCIIDTIKSTVNEESYTCDF